MNFQSKVLKYIAEQDIYNDVLWDEDLNFYVNCNDLFWWGTGDAEDLTEADFELLKQSYKDTDDMVGGLLYCCRKRNMRPQGAYYKSIEEEYWHLFDACGPEREITHMNPHKQITRGEYNELFENQQYDSYPNFIHYGVWTIFGLAVYGLVSVLWLVYNAVS